jgi:hypothetical protein|tara:strand:- start:339 stop:530 length:192 start_codon:yes stop_codon:yes gene_type:complete
MTFQEQEQAKHVVDVLAATGTGAAFLGYVPDAVALLTLVWVALRIWEMDTVRGITGRKIDKNL